MTDDVFVPYTRPDGQCGIDTCERVDAVGGLITFACGHSGDTRVCAGHAEAFGPGVLHSQTLIQCPKCGHVGVSTMKLALNGATS